MIQNNATKVKVNPDVNQNAHLNVNTDRLAQKD
jgi:hypothetical protein